MRFFSQRFKIYIFILLGLALYSNAIANGFVGDDTYQILNNTNVHSLANILQFFTGSTYYNADPTSLIGAYYRPIMMTAYAIIYSLFGPNPHMFHLIQILFHIANTILVYFFLKKFFKPTLSFILALIFLIHPQNNETVVYIANLQDTLFLFFGLIGFLFIIYKPQKIFLALSFFFLSLLSKETGILFFGFSLFYLFLFRPKQTRVWAIGSFIVLSFYFILRVPIAHIGDTHMPLAPITLASLQERLLTIPAIIFFYLQTFFYPWNISALHFWVIKTDGVQTFYLPLLLTLGFFSFLIWFGNKISDVTRIKTLVFFSLWTLLGVFLHLHIIAVLDATAADRWFYFSFIGMLGILGILFEKIVISSTWLKLLVISLIIFAVISLGGRTYLRNFDWQDTLTLYEHDNNYSSSNFLTNNAIGTEYINAGEFQKAKPFILASVKEYPYFANLNNAAIIALHEKQIDQARGYLKEAVEKSSNYLIYENYSSFLIIYGPTKDAKAFTQQAVEKFPQSQKLRENLKKITK